MIAIDHGGGGGQVAFLLNNGEGDKKIMLVLLMEEGGICQGWLGDCDCPLTACLKILIKLQFLKFA